MKPTLRQAMDESVENYARSFIQAAGELGRHSVYKRMAGALGISQRYQREKHSIPEEEPLVHIDFGSGTAALLRELSKAHAETPHVLIGVEANERLAQESVQEIEIDAIRVGKHIVQGVEVGKENGRDVARASFEPDQKIIDEMDVTPNGRILILRDDARSSMKVLCAVLDKLKAAGISRITSTSITLSGVSGDMAYWGEESWKRKTHNEFLAEKTERLVSEMVQNVAQFSRNRLDESGVLFLAQRLNLSELQKLWEHVNQQSFPEDEDARNGILMAGSRELLLHQQADAFKTRLFSVLVEDLAAIERHTNISYGFTTFGQGQMRLANRESKRSLVAMSLVKK